MLLNDSAAWTAGPVSIFDKKKLGGRAQMPSSSLSKYANAAPVHTGPAEGMS